MADENTTAGETPAGSGTAGAAGGAGGGSGTPGATPSPSPAADPNLAGTIAGAEAKPATAPSDWPDGWRQKLAGDDKAALKQLERMNDPAQVFKSFRELQAEKSSGKWKPVAPGADAPPAEMEAWRKDNGIPNDASGYVEKLALPNGMVLGDADKPIVAQFAEAALAKNVAPEAFSDLVTRYYAIQDQQAQKIVENDNRVFQESTDKLNSEWGPEYRANINAIKNVLGQHALDNILTARMADGTKVGGNYETLKGLANLAREVNPMAALTPMNGGDPAKHGEARIKELETRMRTDRGAWFKDEAAQNEYVALLDAREKMKARG